MSFNMHELLSFKKVLLYKYQMPKLYKNLLPYRYRLIKIIHYLTKIDLHTPATAWHAADVGKSMGRLGSPKIDTRGRRPFWFTNS